MQDIAIAGIVSPRSTVSEVWADFEKRNGSDFHVTNHLLGKLESFPKFKSPHRIREIESLRRIGRHISACSTRYVSLKSMDYPHCQNLIREKVPGILIFRWRQKASDKSLPQSYLLQETDVFIDEYSDPLFTSKPTSPRALLTGYPPEHLNSSYEDRRHNPTKPDRPERSRNSK